MLKYFKKSDFHDQEIIDYWDNIYDRQGVDGDAFRKRMEKALTWAYEKGRVENPRIIDIGCGAGRLTTKASEKSTQIFGMDYSHGMLVKAKNVNINQGVRHVRFFQGDIEALPIEDSSFDVIISLGVISFLSSPEKAFQEINRVLIPGGTLVISFINKARLIDHLDLPKLISGTVRKVLIRGKNNHRPDKSQSTDYSSKAYFIPYIRKSIEAAGFNITKQETITVDLFTFYGHEVFPRKISTKLSWVFDQFANLPFVGSLGGWCLLKAIKYSN